jgi:hypothetical protein
MMDVSACTEKPYHAHHSMSASRSVTGFGASNPCRPRGVDRHPRNEQETARCFRRNDCPAFTSPCGTPDRGASHRTLTWHARPRRFTTFTLGLGLGVYVSLPLHRCTARTNRLRRHVIKSSDLEAVQVLIGKGVDHIVAGQSFSCKI